MAPITTTASNQYSRRHIAESLLNLSGQIHPAYCIGRQKSSLNDIVTETFAHAFFARASSEELALLWKFAEEQAKHGELLISFTLKGFDSIRNLTAGEMKNFDFSKFTWEVCPLCPTEDELREIHQSICSVVFTPRYLEGAKAYCSKKPTLLKNLLKSSEFSKIQEARTLYESCHGKVSDEIEVIFFRKQEANKCPREIQDEVWTEVISFNFGDAALRKNIYVRRLYVELAMIP